METALAVISIIAAVVSLAAALRALAAAKRAHHHRNLATGYAEAARQRAQWLQDQGWTSSTAPTKRRRSLK